MRIVSWNLGIAYGPYREHHDRAWRALLDLDPGIAFLQEAVPPAWLPPEWHVVTYPFELWGSAVISRFPLTPIAFAPESHLGRFGAYLALAHAELPDGTRTVVGSVHERTRPASRRLLAGLDGERMRRPSVPEPWWNDVVWHGLADLVRGERFLLGGDWNTSRWVDADGNPEPAGQEFHDRAAADGWVDLHHRIRGREVRSWFGTMSAREHQPDVIFADQWMAGRVADAWVEQGLARDGRLSDHAPVIVEVDPGG